jgi:cell division protein FtsA
MEPSEVIVGLDIGTTKICAIAGRLNEFGKIEVLGIGKSESHGVMRGVVANIDKTVQAIKDAVSQAESMAGIEIDTVHVGIAGQHIKSYQHRGILVRENTSDEVNKQDVRKLVEQMNSLAFNPGDEIIHILPQEFIVDNEHFIKDPIGMSGVRLEANFHIITGQITAAQNINKCVHKAGLQVADLILEPLASSASVLGEEEKEAGVALVDIGGGTTDIAIFQDHIIRHTASIPFGGNSITEDIKEGCTVVKSQAEQLKTKFGAALANETKDNEIVSIPGLKNRPPKEISVRNLSHIIQARMEEILEHIYFEIRSSGFDRKLIAGIVLTGGGSQLKNLVQLVEYVTGMDARIGYPTEHLANSKVDGITNPMNATGIGLIINGYESMEEEREKELVDSKGSPTDNWLGKIFEKSREWLEEDDKNLH